MNPKSRPCTSGTRRSGTGWPAFRAARAALACALLASVGWSGAAAASVLYRCFGPNGEVAYVSHTAGYTDCREIGAWPTPRPRPVEVADRQAQPPRSGNPPSVVPGKPPRPVEANPRVLKVTPLGESSPIEVQKIERQRVWKPFPVAVLDALGSKLLPRVLGVEVKAPPAPQSNPPPVPAATAPIPLRVEADPAQPRPPRTGAVYRVVEKNGTVLYTNIAALAHKGDARMMFTYIVDCYACDVNSRIDWATVPLHLAAYRDDVSAAARLTGVDGALLRAVIHAESGFNPRALSYKGAQGLMQLMPGTAFELGVGDAFDPAENISGGARYLAALLHDFHGNVNLAAAAYNAGAGAVAKYRGVPPYAETEVYVKRVALLYQRYRKALAGSGAAIAAAAVN